MSSTLLQALEARLRSQTAPPPTPTAPVAAQKRKGYDRSFGTTSFKQPKSNEEACLFVLHDKQFLERPELAAAHIMQGDAIDRSAAGAQLWHKAEADLQNELLLRSQYSLQAYVQLLMQIDVKVQLSFNTQALPEYVAALGDEAAVRPDIQCAA